MTYNDANYQIIILAAGNSTRMESNLPKVIHKVGGVPMLQKVLKNALNVTNDVIIVYTEELIKYLRTMKMCRFVLQEQPKGTAIATYAAIDLIKNKKILVLYANHLLITPKLCINN